MELKVLGERLRMIRKHLGINQQELADATNLTQPAISRLEKGDEVYASTLLAVLSFYQLWRKGGKTGCSCSRSCHFEI